MNLKCIEIRALTAAAAAKKKIRIHLTNAPKIAPALKCFVVI